VKVMFSLLALLLGAGSALGATGVSAPGILDSRAPVIQIAYPAGSEVFRSSTPETLLFTIDEQSWAVPPAAITLWFLVEGSPPDQVSITPDPNGSYQYVWEVPTLPGYSDIEARIRVSATDGLGWTASAYSDWFTVLDDVSPVPGAALAERLGPVHPNPFNPRTTISFSLAGADEINLAVFDVQGHRVATLARGSFSAGEHQVPWDGTTDRGNKAASGAYFALLSIGGPTGNHHLVTRLTLVK